MNRLPAILVLFGAQAAAAGGFGRYYVAECRP